MAKVKWAISPYDRVLLELEDATRWIGHSELFKRCQTTFPDALEFNGVIRNLLYLQEIVGRTVPTGGRPRTEYRHAGNGFLDSPGAEDRILGILRRRGGCLTRTELLRISHIRAKDLDTRVLAQYSRNHPTPRSESGGRIHQTANQRGIAATAGTVHR